ncbi:unnamed protein product [Paramecium octaurelia]|uniref:Protein kinase domain-containing protein n=1 Tax=Paramecium octaurelia TaxID=43137 RepID=A0A8S1YS59_PAROT|nr:unnamed protein product [Paramecium octaurelia]
MNQIEELREYPFLLKGILRKDNLWFEVESLQERLTRKLVKVDQLYKIMFHITILVFECQKRSQYFLKSLRIDQIYLNKDEKYSNVFLFEEDQLSSTQEQQTPQKLLYNLFKNLGFALPYDFFQINDHSQEKLLNEILANIFEEKIQDKQYIFYQGYILRELYNFEILSCLLSSQVKRVYLIKKPFYVNSSADSIVLKWVKFRTEEERADLQHEIKQLKLLSNCDRIAKWYCYDSFADQKLIFRKYYDYTLEQINNDIGQKDVNWGDLMHLIKEMIQALKELHSRNIYHRDLKPQYIMFESLSGDRKIQQMRCVLNNFKKSSQIQEDTLEYQPPEGTQERYEPAYNIWQLGYIIQSMLLRRNNRKLSLLRFRPIEIQEYKLIFKDDKDQVNKRNLQLSRILFQMLRHNPLRRPQELEQIEEFFKNWIEKNNVA